MMIRNFDIDRSKHRKKIYKKLLRRLKRERRQAIRQKKDRINGYCYHLYIIMYDYEECDNCKYRIEHFWELKRLKPYNSQYNEHWWTVSNPKYNKTRIDTLKNIIKYM